MNIIQDKIETVEMSQIEKGREFFKAGFEIAIDKPLRWTSFDVVNKIRKQLCMMLKLKKLKVGHAGTLDPLATGVLVICFGKSTKKIEEIQQTKKCYEAIVRLGETTPSFDLETDIDAKYPYEHITEEQVKSVLQTFEGTQEQIPPLFSAVKVNGKRAYDIARSGESVELKPKKIFIEKIELLSFTTPDIHLKVTCSKGTYIRAIARDIGKALGCGAHLRSLKRTAVGDFTLADAISPNEFRNYVDKILMNL